MNRTIPNKIPADPMNLPLIWMEGIGELVVQMELAFPHRPDADCLARASQLALDAEPAPGRRLVNHWRKPSWLTMTDNHDRAFRPLLH